MGTIFERLAKLEQAVDGINRALKEHLDVNPGEELEGLQHVKVITERITRLIKAKNGDPVSLQEIKRELPGVQGSQIHASLKRSGKFRKLERGWYEMINGDGDKARIGRPLKKR